MAAAGDKGGGNGKPEHPYHGAAWSPSAGTPIARKAPPKSFLDGLDGGVQFTDHCEDAHAIAHAMGERFISEDCRAFAIACGFEPLPGGVA